MRHHLSRDSRLAAMDVGGGFVGAVGGEKRAREKKREKLYDEIKKKSTQNGEERVAEWRGEKTPPSRYLHACWIFLISRCCCCLFSMLERQRKPGEMEMWVKRGREAVERICRLTHTRKIDICCKKISNKTCRKIEKSKTKCEVLCRAVVRFLISFFCLFSKESCSREDDTGVDSCVG